MKLPACLATQREIQEKLRCRHEEAGFAQALEDLTRWSIESGYLDPGIMAQDESHSVPIDEYGISFQLQLNNSRKRYASPPSGLPREQNPRECALCYENVDSAHKPLLRVYEFRMRGRDVFIQLTPFPLCAGHYVLIERDHRPMRMGPATFEDLAEFLEMLPGSTACSNSDVMWAGASILAHHHYQVFRRLELPVMKATIDEAFARTANGVEEALLHYPATVLRLKGESAHVIARCGDVLMRWKNSDPGRATANVVMHKNASGQLVVNLLFRHCEYRTAPEWVPYKQEGVGVLEIAGMVILPSPSGDDAMQQRAELLKRAPKLVPGIIESNSPVRECERAEFWKRFAK